VPFDGDQVNWKDFAVMLDKPDISRLPEILKSFSENDIKNKREVMGEVWMRFT
jgi:hypothetical protein